MEKIPDQYTDLLTEPVTVGLATLLPDGQPQVTPVWVDFDGTYVKVNTSANRQKARDMQARPQVTVLAIDPKNPQRYLEVRGKVVNITEEGALEHIDKMAKKYAGLDKYPWLQPGEVRVIAYIEPTRVYAQG